MPTARVDEFEDNLIWRAADLLGVSSRERIDLRQRVAAKSRRYACRSVRPVTLITGASCRHRRRAGAGLCGHGHDLVLTARREERLEALADAIAAAGSATAAGAAARSCAARCGGADRRGADGARVEPRQCRQQCGLWSRRAKRPQLDRDDQLGMIDLNVRALTDLSLVFRRQPRAASRRHPQRRLGRGLSARARLGGLLRRQGLRVVVQRGAAAELRAARHSRHLPVPRPGGDELSGPRRHAVRRLAAVAAGGLGPTRGRSRLSRTDARQRVVVPGWPTSLAVLVPRSCRAASCWRSSIAGNSSAQTSPEGAAYRSRIGGLAIAHQPDRSGLARRLPRFMACPMSFAARCALRF